MYLYLAAEITTNYVQIYYPVVKFNKSCVPPHGIAIYFYKGAHPSRVIIITCRTRVRLRGEGQNSLKIDIKLSVIKVSYL